MQFTRVVSTVTGTGVGDLGPDRSKTLTGNGNVSFELPPLRVGKEQHHSFPVMPAEDAKILADALFTPAFRLSLSHSADKNQLGA
jgi:hypothetical protein